MITSEMISRDCPSTNSTCNLRILWEFDGSRSFISRLNHTRAPEDDEAQTRSRGVELTTASVDPLAPPDCVIVPRVLGLSKFKTGSLPASLLSKASWSIFSVWRHFCKTEGRETLSFKKERRIIIVNVRVSHDISLYSCSLVVNVVISSILQTLW